MHDVCLFLNYYLLIPAISRVQPGYARSLVNFTGNIGKPIGKYTSFIHDFPAAPVGIEALRQYLKIDQQEAESIVKSYYAVESRWELENRWIESNRTDYIDRIFRPEDLSILTNAIRSSGPCILLTAHTMNFYTICWALQRRGLNIALVMMDPRGPGRSNAILRKRNIRAMDAIHKTIPVIFTSPGGTVKNCQDAIRNGYSVVLLIDIPSTKKNGAPVTMFGTDLMLPTGCLHLYEATRAPIIIFFPFTLTPASPYDIAICPPIRYPERLDLQIYAGLLDQVVRKAPASWCGWFYWKLMIEGLLRI